MRPEREPLFLGLTHGRRLLFSPAVSFSADGEERRATDDGIHFHAAGLHWRAGATCSSHPLGRPSLGRPLRACVERSADLPRPAERRYAVAAERQQSDSGRKKPKKSAERLALVLRRENVMKRPTVRCAQPRLSGNRQRQHTRQCSVIANDT